jgi:hypothetical protein
VTGDRVDVYTPETWTGPDYALGMVDEIVGHNAVAHFEMSSESDGYLHIQSPRREVFARIYARPTTEAEQQQMAARGDPDPLPLALLCVEVEIDEETPEHPPSPTSTERAPT